MSTKFFVNAGVFLLALIWGIFELFQLMIFKLKRFFHTLKSPKQEVVMERIIVAKTTSDLKAGIDDATEKDARRIVIQDRRAKRAHRAVKAFKSITPKQMASLAAAIARADFVNIIQMLMDWKVGPRKIMAVEALGVKRSYELGRKYREVNYVESDNHAERECVFELK